MQQKVNWVDILKGIGILAVVLGHMNSPFGGFIFSWHMPLFFMASGFFLKTNLSYSAFMKKDFLRLSIPYSIFITLALLVETIKRFALRREAMDLNHELIGLSWHMDMPRLSSHYGFVLWFLPALFFGKIFVVTTAKLSHNNKAVMYLLCSVLFYLSFKVDLPFAIDEGLNATFWIVSGHFFYKVAEDRSIAFFAPVVILILYFFDMPSLNMAGKEYSNIFLNIIWAFCCVWIFVGIARGLDAFLPRTSQIFAYLGTLSLLIFILHPYTNNFAHIFLAKIGLDKWYLKFILSLLSLLPILFLKFKFDGKGIFKYV